MKLLFIVTVLGLAGAFAVQVEELVVAFVTTEQLPSGSFFAVLFWLWFASALAVVWCGLRGGYLAIKNNHLENPYLTAFAVMYCLVLKSNDYEFGWSILRIAFTIGLDFFAIGVNILGFALVAWLRAARNEYPAAPKPEPVRQLAQ